MLRVIKNIHARLAFNAMGIQYYDKAVRYFETTHSYLNLPTIERNLHKANFDIARKYKKRLQGSRISE
ncbi:MAG: hypothetical protein JW920_11130 [Deltaproteobacteria bacterium]|nr:hypothetical protein [Deltaproteobacteria bacterium]